MEIEPLVPSSPSHRVTPPLPIYSRRPPPRVPLHRPHPPARAPRHAEVHRPGGTHPHHRVDAGWFPPATLPQVGQGSGLMGAVL